MIELKNICKTYQMGEASVAALANVSLSITPGEFVAIMGPSGSGKSTLMHVLGLLDRPDTGSYSLGNTEVSGLPDVTCAVIRNSVMGFIFQQFHLLAKMSAVDNAALPLVYSGQRRHSLEAARQRIALVGLRDRSSHRPNQLSGGQQQRVAIARALVNDPVLILADEPTGNLDSKNKEDILQVLHELHQQGKTIVVVTHEKEVAAHADRIISMRDGRIVSDERVRCTPRAAYPHADISQRISSIAATSSRHRFLLNLHEYCRQAAVAMLAHKMRSLLSILGILIGVTAVIAMLAIGEGAKASIQKQLASLGSNLLVVRPGSAKLHGVSLASDAVTRFTLTDVREIKEQIAGAKRVSPSVTGRGQIVYENKNWNTQVEGVDTDYEHLRASVPAVGKFFTQTEVRDRVKCAILGLTVARELFGDTDPLGKTIKINRINFTVIGVLPTKGANSFRDQDDVILIPFTTAMYRVFGKQYIDSIFIEVANSSVMDDVQTAVESLLRKLHRIDPSDEDSFEIRNMSDIKNALTTTTKTMALLLGSIAAISLVVGGIGIMNIMLVSVTERTREIGLRKAIGANTTDIMVQFLIEAVLLSSIGGVCGIVLGTGVSLMIAAIAGWSVKVSAASIVLAAVFSLSVGVLFGLWPARQAARLNPIAALRYE